MKLQNSFDKVKICVIHGNVVILAVIRAGAMGKDSRIIPAPIGVMGFQRFQDMNARFKEIFCFLVIRDF